MPARRWLTQKEAAEYLGCTDKTIRNYISQGRLTGYKVSGLRTVRIDVHDIDALMRRIPTGNAA